MKRRILVQLLAFSVLTFISGNTLIAQQNRLTEVSFVSLLANPEKYDGKRVRISGFLHVQFEDNAIYLHKDDADHLIGDNALWVDYVEKPSLEPVCKDKFSSSGANARFFDGRYVLIEGKFNMKRRGHLGAFSGTIEEVSRVLELRRWFDGTRKVTVIDNNGRLKDDCK